jgi:hypothetical protein
VHLQHKLVIRKVSQDDVVFVGHGGAPSGMVSTVHGLKATLPLLGKRHTPNESRQKPIAGRNVVANVPYMF